MNSFVGTEDGGPGTIARRGPQPRRVATLADGFESRVPFATPALTLGPEPRAALPAGAAPAGALMASSGAARRALPAGRLMLGALPAAAAPAGELVEALDSALPAPPTEEPIVVWQPSDDASEASISPVPQVEAAVAASRVVSEPSIDRDSTIADVVPIGGKLAADVKPRSAIAALRSTIDVLSEPDEMEPSHGDSSEAAEHVSPIAAVLSIGDRAESAPPAAEFGPIGQNRENLKPPRTEVRSITDLAENEVTPLANVRSIADIRRQSSSNRVSVAGLRSIGDVRGGPVVIEQAPVLDARSISEMLSDPQGDNRTESTAAIPTENLPAAGVTIDEFPAAERPSPREKDTPPPAAPVVEFCPEDHVHAAQDVEYADPESAAAEPVASSVTRVHTRGPVSGITGWRASDKGSVAAAPVSTIIEF